MFNYTVDPLGRRRACSITPESGVAGSDSEGTCRTTEQSFQYDGLSRMTKAVDTI